jgi:hypothetical protein
LVIKSGQGSQRETRYPDELVDWLSATRTTPTPTHAISQENLGYQQRKCSKYFTIGCIHIPMKSESVSRQFPSAKSYIKTLWIIFHNIVPTYEPCFMHEGVFNIQDSHLWGRDNHQRILFSVSVSTQIIWDIVVDPTRLLHGRLTTQRHHEIFRKLFYHGYLKICLYLRVELSLYYGRRSVDQFVLVSGSPLGPMTRFYPYSFFSDNCFNVLPVGRPL